MSEMAPLTRDFYAVVPATAAGADFEVTVCAAPFTGTVTAVTYIADTAITGADTDSRTLQVFNKGAAGAGTTKAAEKALTLGVNAAAFDETAVTLSGTAANLVVTEGDVLSFKSLHVGSTGLADPGGTVKITLSRS